MTLDEYSENGGVVDPKLDMLYILMEQTQKERGRITPAFKQLVYDAFGQ